MAGQDKGHTLEAIWSKVAAVIREELGDAPFNSYIAPSVVRLTAVGSPCLVTPTAYGRDWLRKNAMNRLGELWAMFDPLVRTLGLRSRAEHEADGGQPVDAGPTPAQAAAETDFEGAVSDLSEGQRRTRTAGLQERLSFDSFVAGQGNEFAYAMARQVAGWADGHFNPVFLHGPYGYGKTHLLNAIAWEAQRVRPDARVIFLTAERFLSGFVRAVMDRTTAAFKEELRGADLLLIDDVQFFGGKQSTQEELLHTLTALIEDGRRVVLSGDRPPSAMTDIDARLRSHLGAGLICPVEAGDKSLRLAVVERKLQLLAQRKALDLPARPEVLQFLAERVPGTIRQLDGALNTLPAVAGDRLSRLSLDEVQTLLRPNLTGGIERRITVDEIQKTTAEHYGLKKEDLLSERRTRSIARPRQVAMYLCKLHTTRSYPDIGRRFGGRDHTTVLHGVKKIEELLAKDEQIARDVESLSRKLRG